jgi:hypothetical protein
MSSCSLICQLWFPLGYCVVLESFLSAVVALNTVAFRSSFLCLAFVISLMTRSCFRSSPVCLLLQDSFLLVSFTFLSLLHEYSNLAARTIFLGNFTCPLLFLSGSSESDHSFPSSSFQNFVPKSLYFIFFL